MQMIKIEGEKERKEGNSSHFNVVNHEKVFCNSSFDLDFFDCTEFSKCLLVYCPNG